MTKKVRCVAIQLGKKGLGFGEMKEVVLIAILITLLVIFIGTQIVPKMQSVGKFTIEQNAQQGKLIVQQKDIEPGKAGDLDGDGIFDLYDICVYQKAGEWVGKKDSDADGMPDACDETPLNPKVKLTCKEGMQWDKESAKAGVHKCILKTA